jgi:hypothetical protein
MVNLAFRRWPAPLVMILCPLVLCALLRGRAQSTDPLDAAVETARRAHDEARLGSLQAQLEGRIKENTKDARVRYQLSLGAELSC